MLTRVEIDGFKTFDAFEVDLAPFSAVVGLNAAGKSNLFDALRLLSRLADSDAVDAMRGVRGEPWEQFRDFAPDAPSAQASFAIEVLLPQSVRDPFAQSYPLRCTRMRYEIKIEYRSNGGPSRPYVVGERASRLTKATDALSGVVHPSRLRYGAHQPYLETTHDGAGPEFAISQDGNQGRKQRRPATRATASVLSTMRDTTFPHLFALAEELRSWRFLHFDPAGLREPSDETSGDRLLPDGRNLASVLGQLSELSGPGEARAPVIAQIAEELSELIDGVIDLKPRYDRQQRRWEVEFESATDGDVSARVASDGTLRLTALLCAVLDPRSEGLICFEEPENGVHPQRLGPLLDLLADLVTDWRSPDAGESLRQLIINSHSPVVVASLIDRPQVRILFAERARRAGTGRTGSTTVARPVYNTLVADSGEGGVRPVTRFEVDRYLETAKSAAP